MMVREMAIQSPCTLTAASASVAFVALAFVALAAGPTSAETSSWSRRAPQAPPPVTGAPSPKVTPKRRTSVPSLRPQNSVASGSPIQGPLPGLKKKLGPSSAIPKGKNAAFIAYELGLYANALRLAKAEAKAKSPQAHTLLGLMHARGLGVGKDLRAAAVWYAKAAELGDTEGIFAYALMLAQGRGVKKDPGQAAALFERAAMKGHAYAHYNLGLAFLSGSGKPENPHRAAAHLRFAAERGISRAQYDLAALYRNGHGVQPDAYMASYWLRSAAANGLTEAEYEYAVTLLRGEGLNEDRPRVVDYLKAAANKGVAGAQNRLAYIYFEGRLVKRDPIEGTKWRTLAKEGGIADKSLDSQVTTLSDADRKKALNAAQRFRETRAIGIAVGG
ncbi:MAG: tetratricopeptide repeat protein [Pseudomonadota bacterium]